MIFIRESSQGRHCIDFFDKGATKHSLDSVVIFVGCCFITLYIKISNSGFKGPNQSILNCLLCYISVTQVTE